MPKFTIKTMLFITATIAIMLMVYETYSAKNKYFRKPITLGQLKRERDVQFEAPSLLCIALISLFALNAYKDERLQPFSACIASVVLLILGPALLSRRSLQSELEIVVSIAMLVIGGYFIYFAVRYGKDTTKLLAFLICTLYVIVFSNILWKGLGWS